MPNQNNFRSDITNTTESRFLASRIVKNPQEYVLLEQIPASFAFNTTDNIEVHFYTIPTNILLVSMVISMADLEILKSHLVSYSDGTIKNYIRIDFTKAFEKKNIVITPGEYKMVLNYFSDEIGSYYDKNMYVQEISDSRTEVQLAFINNSDEITVANNKKSLYEFLVPSVNKSFAVGVAEKIFKSGIDLTDSTEGLTYDGIIDNISIPTIGQTYENTIAKVNALGQERSEQFQLAVNTLLINLYKNLRERIVIRSDNRIQEEEFQQLIKDALVEELPKIKTSIDKKIILS